MMIIPAYFYMETFCSILAGDLLFLELCALNFVMGQARIREGDSGSETLSVKIIGVLLGLVQEQSGRTEGSAYADFCACLHDSFE